MIAVFLFFIMLADHYPLAASHSFVWAAQIYPKSKSSKKPEPLTAEKLMARLDRLEEEDQQFLQAMDGIKSELAIIKTRAAVSKRVINQLSSGVECP